MATPMASAGDDATYGPTDAVRILRAVVADAGELLTLQRAAYVTEAQAHRDAFLPPLTQTLAQLVTELRPSAGSDRTRLIARDGARLVGSVAAERDGDVLRISRLMVAPDLQGGGLGSRLLAAAEALAGGQVTRYTLFTGVRSERNLAMYARRGYERTGVEAAPGGTEVVHLAKPASPR